MAALAIGVDVGGTKVLAAAVDPAAPATPVVRHRIPTPAGPGALTAAVAEAALAVQEALAAAGHPPATAIGVGLPGLIDRQGVLRVAPNLPGAVEVPIAGPLAEVLGLPVVVDNDANCAAWAEVTCGAGRGASHAVLVTLGTGIGGGVVLGGRLHHGAHGFAGEPGHMVVDPSGPPCPCGRRGCWERYASGSGLGWLARRAVAEGRAPGVLRAAGGDPEAVRGEHVGLAARAGDEGADAVWDEFAWWLGLGVANLVNLADPDVVLIGGGLADVADLFLDRTRAAFRALVLGGPERPATRLEAATLGSSAGAIGAALLAAAHPG